MSSQGVCIVVVMLHGVYAWAQHTTDPWGKTPSRLDVCKMCDLAMRMDGYKAAHGVRLGHTWHINHGQVGHMWGVDGQVDGIWRHNPALKLN